MTQHRLALLAGVSTPTISRFENGEKDLQLSSVMRILSVLGIVDSRTLIFTHPRPVYDAALDAVRFQGRCGTAVVRCAISREALEDHFAGARKNVLKSFTAHQTLIEHEARRLYFLPRLEPDGAVLIRTLDLVR